jgi:hypothetical protein
MALEATVRQYGADPGFEKLHGFRRWFRCPHTYSARQRGEGGDPTGEPFGIENSAGVLQGAAPALSFISSPIGGKSFNRNALKTENKFAKIPIKMRKTPVSGQNTGDGGGFAQSNRTVRLAEGRGASGCRASE